MTKKRLEEIKTKLRELAAVKATVCGWNIGGFSSDPFLKTFLDFAYPIGDFFSLTASIVLSSLSFNFLIEKYKHGIFALLFGMAGMFLADFYFSYSTNNGTYFDGGIADLLFCIGMFLLTFGALGFIEQKDKKQYESNIHKTRFLMYY